MASVPSDLWLLQSFLDSIDMETAGDDLESLPRFRRWLSAHDRVSAAKAATAADLEVARELRRGLRSVLNAHAVGTSVAVADAAALDQLARRVPLAVGVALDGTPVLRPGAGGGAGVLGEVLVAAVTAAVDGRWARLRLCANDECSVVFYDQSRNASRRWCDMGVCGNRMKLRAYRARHRSGAEVDQ